MKKQLLTLGAIGAIVTPVVTVVACGGNKSLDYIRVEDEDDISAVEKGFAENKDKHKNVMSTFYNATDMLASLGYYPDFASVSSLGQIYSDFLKPILGDNNKGTKEAETNTGKYVIKGAPTVMDGQTVDTEAIARNEISTMLLNEWERVDEAKYTSFVPALLYTSMADGKAQDKDEAFITKDTFQFGLDFVKAWVMLAKGMDRAYPGHNFVDQAKATSLKIRTNISKLADVVQGDAKFANKKVMILDPMKANNNIALSARGADVYNVLYSKNKAHGLGFDFPTPKNIKNIKYGTFSVKAADNATFTNEFGQSSDYVLILNSGKWTNDELTTIKSEAKKLLKDQSEGSQAFVVERPEFYETIWGPYGTNKFLTNFAQLLNIQYQANTIEEFSSSRTLEKLR